MWQKNHTCISRGLAGPPFGTLFVVGHSKQVVFAASILLGIPVCLIYHVIAAPYEGRCCVSGWAPFVLVVIRMSGMAKESLGPLLAHFTWLPLNLCCGCPQDQRVWWACEPLTLC
jgi:hypothetical protein